MFRKLNNISFVCGSKSEFSHIHYKLLEFYDIEILWHWNFLIEAEILASHVDWWPVLQTFLHTLFLLQNFSVTCAKAFVCASVDLVDHIMENLFSTHCYYILCSSSIQKFATVLCKEPYDRAALTLGKNSDTFSISIWWQYLFFMPWNPLVVLDRCIHISCSPAVQKFATVSCKEPYDRAALTLGKNSGTFSFSLRFSP